MYLRGGEITIFIIERGDEWLKVPATRFDTTNIVQSSNLLVFFIGHSFRSSFMSSLIKKNNGHFKSLQIEVTFDVFYQLQLKTTPNKITFMLYIYFVIIWSPYVSLYHYFYSEQFKKSVETDQPKADFTFVVVSIYI